MGIEDLESYEKHFKTEHQPCSQYYNKNYTDNEHKSLSSWCKYTRWKSLLCSHCDDSILYFISHHMLFHRHFLVFICMYLVYFYQHSLPFNGTIRIYQFWKIPVKNKMVKTTPLETWLQVIRTQSVRELVIYS